jgi:hypothetical protein
MRCAKYSGYGRSKKRKRRKSYRGYGRPVRVFSGFGKLGIGVDAIAPPMVGGGVTMATSLLLRAFVPPIPKEGEPKTDPETGEVIPHWAFRFSGLLGAGAGALASAALIPWAGWGGFVSGVLTSALAGGTAQMYNYVVSKKKGYYQYRGMVAMQPRYYGRPGYGQARWKPYGAVRSPKYAQNYKGMRGYGAIGALPTQRRFALPGRGVQSIPQEVLNAVNVSAFGGRTATMGTVI